MKNIVFLNSCPVWGGGEKWTFSTAEALNEDDNFNVHIATGRNTKLYEKAKEVNIKTFNIKINNGLSSLNPFKVYKFIKFLKNSQIDILFLNMSQDLKFGGIAGKLAKIDKIIYRRGLAIPIKDRLYNKFLLKSCVTDIIANSKATKRTVLKNTSEWLNEEKIKVIYNGIDLNKIKQDLSNPVNLSEEFNIDQNKQIIGNIGRLSYQKGHELLINAVDIIKDKRDDFVVLIIGSGEREKELKEFVNNKNLDSFVKFTGFRNDVYKLLPSLDFLLHTARWEGFGFVIAEAMAAGLPVVSTDSSNIPEIVVDGKTGFLAENENVEDIAFRTLKMMDQYEKSNFGKAGKEVIKEKFTKEIMINNIKMFLEE